MSLESFFVLMRPLFGGTGFVLAFVGLVALILPPDWLEAIGLLNARNASRSEFGLALLVGVGTLIAVQFFDKGSLFQRYLALRAEKTKSAEKRQERRKTLAGLTPDEKGILVRFMNGETSIWFDMAHAIGQGLLAQQILFRPAVDGVEYKFAGTLQPWAREILVAHPEILADATPPRNSTARSRRS